jgi:NhaA family Na+:H+ antiporter
LPLIAAAGGVLGSAFLYIAYVQLKHETVLTMGWPIATAVDLAAAYFLLKIVFRRSSPAYPFLLLSAIAADAFALTVVALRHFGPETRAWAILLLLAAIGLAGVFKAVRIRAFWPYLAVCGPLSWFGLYWSGLHPALALVPIVPFLPHRPRGINLLENDTDSREHTRHIEHEWAYVVQPVVFLFGLVNGGVQFTSYGTGSWALVAGALAGRPLGMLAAVGLALAAGWHLPRRLHWRDLIVVATATSGGFTLALFAATAVFPIGPLLGEAKVGALLTVAGVAVAFGLARVLHVGKFAHPPQLVQHPRRAQIRHAVGH